MVILEKTCCFTGHRLQKLPWKSDEQSPMCIKFKEKLRQQIIDLINQGYVHFISGMALGSDMICAETVLSLKKEFPQITLEGAIPCPEQADRWHAEQRNRYNYLLEQCDSINISSPNYTYTCMHIRNNYMVNNSNAIIAIWDGSPGGTKNTIELAKKKNLEIYIINPFEC